MGMIAEMLRQMHATGIPFDRMIAAVEEVEAQGTRKRRSAVGASLPGIEPAKEKKATRLPADWNLTVGLAKIAFAIGLTEPEIRAEGAKFKDYWTAQPGAKGRKLDWDATWRNWCRTALERRPRAGMRPTAAPMPLLEAKSGEWESRMEMWRKAGGADYGWSPSWGPRPGSPGCLVPRELLIQETRVS